MTRILLLEDDAPFADLVATSLEAEGFEVESATTASQALDKFAAAQFSLVIADLFITSGGVASRDGGIHLISSIRQLQARNTPIIAMSGSFGKDSGDVFQQTAKTVGATAVLAKPFAPSELLDLTAELLFRPRY